MVPTFLEKSITALSIPLFRRQGSIYMSLFTVARYMKAVEVAFVYNLNALGIIMGEKTVEKLMDQ